MTTFQLFGLIAVAALLLWVNRGLLGGLNWLSKSPETLEVEVIRRALATDDLPSEVVVLVATAASGCFKHLATRDRRGRDETKDAA